MSEISEFKFPPSILDACPSSSMYEKHPICMKSQKQKEGETLRKSDVLKIIMVKKLFD